jgi:hypothetical protein
MKLPNNVLEALRDRQKIKAIKLLRGQRGIGLKEAKDIIDQYLSNDENIFSSTEKTAPRNDANKNYGFLFLGLLIIATFVWAMVNLIEVAGSVIVLWNHDNYRQNTFVVNKVHYDDDYEAGLTWGFLGKLSGSEGEERMYAPRLADAKALGYYKLSKMYPPGMQMKVWYSPTVTTKLFQHRTLNIIPYTADLVNSELKIIYNWLLCCLLPFGSALLFAHMMKKHYS